MRHILLFFIHFSLFILHSSLLSAQRVNVSVSPQGGIDNISISGDKTDMNWIVQTDNEQYKWIGPSSQWGLGRLKVNGTQYEWTKALTSSSEESVFHITDALTLSVTRTLDGDDVIEKYTFRNTGSVSLALSEIDINTPFNDNYPDAATCLNRRCHTHVWAAGSAAYVCAIRMGAYSPHLGLMLTEGELEGYSINERDRERGQSNFRGIISLSPSAKNLRPGEQYTISWRIFSHQGWDDFFARMKKYGGVQVSADKYVALVGEKVKITLSSQKKTKSFFYKITKTGDIRVPIKWNGSNTYVELFGVSDYDDYIASRARFVVDYQQYNNPGDKRDGAFVPYNNRTEERYLNWKMEKNWSDFNEGRERVGEGIFLALLYQQTSDNELKQKIGKSLQRYADFVRYQLQDNDFKTWSDADRADSRISSGGQRHRIYNYPWVAHFYLEMFNVTREKKYLDWAYRTELACYRYSGYSFYCIDTPVKQSITMLRDNGMESQADTLLGEYSKVGDFYMKTGTNFPKSEVNFEQSIVVPSINFICELYLVTHDGQYLDYARKMMPLVEAFGGRQPSSHLNDISIRHWDGYWFGIPQQWGDTMPHYWSCITADCFAHYSLATGDEQYMQRAKTILYGNLSLFTEDGRGGAAYIYPTRVNGESVHGLNPMANDQDFALMYLLKWLMVNG